MADAYAHAYGAGPWPPVNDSYARYEQDLAQAQRESEEDHARRKQKADKYDNEHPSKEEAERSPQAPAKNEKDLDKAADDFGFTKLDAKSPKRERQGDSHARSTQKNYFHLPVEWFEERRKKGSALAPKKVDLEAKGSSSFLQPRPTSPEQKQKTHDSNLLSSLFNSQAGIHIDRYDPFFSDSNDIEC